ncbi:hypothetical protein BDF22DRAFT_743746 [Syncephalis plumigaleata]|nr:hypothetical protein BDF22DRAFT_743746 [Syncephalis plumigaleata]
MNYSILFVALLLAIHSADGQPFKSQLVMGGVSCGTIDGVYYQCDTANHMRCTTMLGRTQSICVRISDEGEGTCIRPTYDAFE